MSVQFGHFSSKLNDRISVYNTAIFCIDSDIFISVVHKRCLLLDKVF